MNDKDDFKAEVSSDGTYVLIAIKIPTFTCAACGKVERSKVNVDRAAQLFAGHNAISDMFSSSRSAGWGIVFGPKIPSPNSFAGYRQDHALVCGDCYAPIARIEEGEKEFVKAALETANNTLAAKVKTWTK